MMQIPAPLKDFSEVIVSAITIIGGIVAFNKTFRNWLKNLWANHVEKKKAKNGMPALLTSISEQLKSMSVRLAQVEYDVKDPNSGSTIKGLLKIIKSEIEVTNWLSPRPTFRTTSAGINVFVNEAYCHLCGVTSDDLMKLGWKNFVVDEEMADDYYLRFRLATKELSQFSGKLKIQANNGEYRGEWMIKVRPLGPIDGNTVGDEINYLWSGCLYPFDDIAKVYAKHANIPAFF